MTDTDRRPRNQIASTGGLVRSSAVVGIGTMLSRVTGLLKTVVLALVLGGATLADGYNLANTTPNMVYDLLIGGLLSATLVPIFVQHIENDDERSTSAVVTVMVTAMVAFTVAALVAAPWIFRIYTWSAKPAERAELIAVGVPLLRWFLPQILFYGLTALATALLNARRSYAAPAFAPVLNNIVVLCALLAFWRVGGRAPTAHQLIHDPALLALLGAGTTAGIVAMTLVLWPALRRSGMRLRWRFDLHNRSVRKVFTMSGWTFAYAVVNQVTLAVVLALAARRDGDPTAYTYAFLFFQLPYGLFAVSLMTTIVPDLSTFVARADADGFRRHFALGLRLLLVVMVPAAVGSAVLGKPIVRALLEHASYRRAAPLTGDLLVLFALGLVGFAVYLYALRVFYTLKDTRTPFFVNCIENGVNLVGAVVLTLVLHWHAQGLAIAYSIAYSVAAVVALVAVRRRIGWFGGRRIARSTLRIVVAAAAMGAAVYAASRAMGDVHGFQAVAPSVIGIVVGILVYGGMVTLLRVEETAELTKRLRRRVSG